MMQPPGQDVGAVIHRRRRGATAVVVFVSVIILALIASLMRGGWQTVGTVDAIQAAGVVYREDLGLFLVAAEPRPLALLDDAQHGRGERVLFCESSGWFVGPHGEMFDRSGSYANGPAASNMDRVALRVRERLVQVRMDRVVRTAGRSVTREEPAGPFCLEGPDGLEESPPGFVATD